MKKLLLTILSLASALLINAQTLTFDWAINIGGAVLPEIH